MNKVRRKELAKAIELMEQAMNIISECREEEQDAFDNLPEGIQDSERGDQMQEYIDMMEEAYDELDDQIDTIYEIVNG